MVDSSSAPWGCASPRARSARVEEEERRPIVGMVYVDKYELPKPYPEKIRVTIELLE